MTKPIDPALRFWPKVNQAGPVPSYRPDLGNCWLFTAYTDPFGYGRFNYNEHMRAAHYFLAGTPPKGLVWDHLCRVRNCVRPAHLELVTPAENTRRAINNSYQRQAAKTHCINGHPFDEANTSYYRGHWRRCKACGAVWTARYLAKKREAAA